MPLVKVKQKYQVTIPATIRSQVPLDVGDVLEATVSEGGILFKPKIVTDRNSMAAKLDKILADKTKKSVYADKSDAELMDEVVKMVKTMRKELKSQRN